MMQGTGDALQIVETPMPESLRFYNSKPRYALLLLLALCFVVGGAFILWHDTGLLARVVGWANLVFFGACAAIFLRQLFDRRPRLLIDDAGVTDRTLGIGTIPWNAIVDARLRRVGRQPFIGLTLRDEAAWLARLGPLKRRVAQANRAAGFDAFNLNLSGVRVDAEAVLACVRAHLQASDDDAARSDGRDRAHTESSAVDSAAAASTASVSTASDVQRAVARMRAGGVVAYPTEAVWGLGCDPANESAVRRLLALKQRDIAKGLIVIAARVEQLAPYTDLAALPAAQRDAVLASWPGPHTWIVPAAAGAPRWLTGNHEGVAVRVSAHPLVIALCEAFGGAIVSTSANPAGAPPPTRLAAFDPDLRAALDAIVVGETGHLSAPTAIRDARSGASIRS